MPEASIHASFRIFVFRVPFVGGCEAGEDAADERVVRSRLLRALPVFDREFA